MIQCILQTTSISKQLIVYTLVRRPPARGVHVKFTLAKPKSQSQPTACEETLSTRVASRGKAVVVNARDRIVTRVEVGGGRAGRNVKRDDRNGRR